MDEPIITSIHNPRIRQLAKLKKRSERDATGTYLLEGVRPLERALAKGITVREAFICPELWGAGGEQALIDELTKQSVSITSLSRDAFTKIAYREHPEGIIVVAEQSRTSLDDLTLPDNPLIIVLEAVEKPGNMGTILRTADAVGADALIVCDPATDIYNPNVIRASTGTMFSVPVVVTDSAQAIEWLKAHHIAICAATPRAEASYSDVDLAQPIAIAVGAEDTGLTDQWIDRSDLPVRLPMRGIADSLNVSAATVVLAYEAIRQRGIR